MRAALRFLRRPATIVGELVALTGTFVVSTVVGPGGVLTSPWFLACMAMALASLSVVLTDQMRRAWRLWRSAPGVDALRQAPYVRVMVFSGPVPAGAPASEVHVRGRLGVWGSPVFHAGILLVVLAGLGRALFGADADLDVMRGETLLPSGWPDAAGRRGLLARPFAFPEALALEEIRVTRHPSGEPSTVEATVRLGNGSDAVRLPIGINNPLRSGADSVYLGAVGGMAALLEIGEGGRMERRAILLREEAAGSAGQVQLADGTTLRAASSERGIGRVAGPIDLRAVRDGALLGASDLLPGKELAVPGGLHVVLAGVVPWARLSGRRDVSTPVVYAGFLLACLGGLLMVSVVRVESAVLREDVEEGVRITVLMRPQRFAPLFAPAFEDLWVKSTAGLGDVRIGDGRARA